MAESLSAPSGRRRGRDRGFPAQPHGWWPLVGPVQGQAVRSLRPSHLHGSRGPRHGVLRFSRRRFSSSRRTRHGPTWGGPWPGGSSGTNGRRDPVRGVCRCRGGDLLDLGFGGGFGGGPGGRGCSVGRRRSGGRGRTPGGDGVPVRRGAWPGGPRHARLLRCNGRALDAPARRLDLGDRRRWGCAPARLAPSALCGVMGSRRLLRARCRHCHLGCRRLGCGHLGGGLCRVGGRRGTVLLRRRPRRRGHQQHADDRALPQTRAAHWCPAGRSAGRAAGRAAAGCAAACAPAVAPGDTGSENTTRPLTSS